MQVAELHKQFLDITNEDINKILHNTVKEYNGKMSLLFLDANYLYNFHNDDFQEVRKFNMLGRYDIKANIEWHRYLERWLQDQTVTLGGKKIKPINIQRSLDRVVNQGLQTIALGITGEQIVGFPFRAIGDADLDEAGPNDMALGNEIDIIDVNNTPDGGSLSVDGSTVFSIGNHDKAVESADFTEVGMFSSDLAPRLMLDHSIFLSPIQHVQNVDSVGSTTIIYMCSS